MVARGLKENLAKLPEHAGVTKVTLLEGGKEFHSIEAKPGKLASVRIYSEIVGRYGGELNVAAAEWALEVYGEFVQESKEKPGSHPNIDILFDVTEKGKGPFEVVVESGAANE